MMRTAWAGQVAAVLLVAAAASSADASTIREVGEIEDIQVYGFGTRPDHEREPKHVRDGVVKDELIETVKDGGMSIRLIDGTHLTLGSESQLIIDEMCFDPNRKEGKSVIDLVVGAYYFVSGRTPKDNVSIQTPVATIGIRGTELSILVTPGGDTYVGVISGGAVVMSDVTGRSVTIDAGESAGVNSLGQTTGVIPGIGLTGDPIVDSIVTAANQKEGRNLVIVAQDAQRLIDSAVSKKNRTKKRTMAAAMGVETATNVTTTGIDCAGNNAVIACGRLLFGHSVRANGSHLVRRTRVRPKRGRIAWRTDRTTVGLGGSLS